MKQSQKSHTHLTSHTKVLQPTPDFSPVQTIGIGTFGAVFLALDVNGKQVAIKKVFLDPRFKNRELEIVEQLHHPNCLQYITNYKTKEGARGEVYLHLVTDYLPSALNYFAKEYHHPNVVYVKLWGLQLFSGLCYLHAHGVCHRDIKPSNILIDPDDGRLQLCDFGSAKMLKSNENSVSYIATRSYRAPELLLDCQRYTTAVDVWAAGCVLGELYMGGRPIFLGQNNNEILTAISKTIGNPDPEDLESYSHTQKYVPTSGNPIPLEHVLPRDAPAEFIDLLKQIFVFSPFKRLTAAQCMEHPFFEELFNPKTVMPNGQPLPSWIKNMQSPEKMLACYAEGPKPA